MSDYLKLLQDRLLEHRYRYYKLDESVINDHEYDVLEKTYIELCEKENVKPITTDNGIGWSENNHEYQKAGWRVDEGIDSYSKWEARMKPIWKKLGPPKYMRNKKDE